ncbi:MAG: signal peptidase I [Nocardioidaceae bacterium]|nr:signal peptidase I [Nocardioidaceae bacterium]
MTSDPGGDLSTPRPAPGDSPAVKAKKRGLPLWQETLLLVTTAIILALIIKTFFLQAFYIPSVSMRETLEVNDRILVEKVSGWFGEVERGDVVVFDDPANWLGVDVAPEPDNPITKTLSAIGLLPTGGHLVKRVMGVEGDRVACVRGTLEVNGAPLEESDYVTLPSQSCQAAFSVEVPDDRLWVMGDNRDQSEDSRAHLGDPGGGFIPVDDVVGKVFVTIWPISHWQLFPRPQTFDAIAAVGRAAGLVVSTAPIGLALASPLPLSRLLGRWKAGPR